jgi:Ankyrin repeats (many copies)
VKIQIKSSEVLILLAVSVMSLFANLPDSFVGNVIDRNTLLAALTVVVVVAMFRYLQMMLLLTISVLAIGANVPAELASELGISQLALIVSLSVLIAITLLNRAFKLLPEKKEHKATEIIEGRQLLLAAIAKGDRPTLHRLLVGNIGVNFTLNGMSPLHLAAEKGYPDIVRMLISYGADFRIRNAEGKTPLEIAQAKRKFVHTEEILYNAGNPYFATSSLTESRRGDAEIWQKQYGY